MRQSKKIDTEYEMLDSVETQSVKVMGVSTGTLTVDRMVFERGDIIGNTSSRDIHYLVRDYGEPTEEGHAKYEVTELRDGTALKVGDECRFLNKFGFWTSK